MRVDKSKENKGLKTRRALLGSGAIAEVAATLGTGAAAAPQAMP